MLGLSRGGHIHVWVVWLSARERTGALLSGLSRTERRMARTFLSGQARMEYISSRFCIRVLASRYLGVGHHKIELHKTAKGQPQLMDPKGTRRHRLNVSLSHCIKGVAVAFGRNARVGVDLETRGQLPATTAAAARLLIGRERTLTSRHQIWDCWARKEAFLKGLGLGLSGLGSIRSLEHQTNVVSSGTTLWTVTSLPLHADCSLACATEGVGRRIKVFTHRSCTTFNRSILNATQIISPHI